MTYAPTEPLIEAPIEEHVRVLLEWLRGDGGLTGEILSVEMICIYREMCSELWLNSRPWRSVASALRKHLGDKKRYHEWRDHTGQRHRTVVWYIPELVPPIRKAA